MYVKHVGLVVENLYESTKFYRGLGFTVHERTNEVWNNHVLEIVKMRPKNPEFRTVIELIKGCWPNHIAIAIDDIASIEQPAIYQKPGVKFINDPDKHIVELVQEVPQNVHNRRDRNQP